jgi:hypothetical protein
MPRSPLSRILDDVVCALYWLLDTLSRLVALRVDHSSSVTNNLPRVGPFTKELVVPRSCIRMLPRTLTPWRHLRLLDLGSNHLSQLPKAIGELASLQLLNLAHNQLTTLPAEIGKLTQLRVLGLRSNQLTALPAEVGDLQELHSLFLTDNRLSELPSTLGRLGKLRKLQAASNQLKGLPAELFAGCSELEMVRVPVNRIQQLPATMGTHPKLCWVSLAGNPMWCDGPGTQRAVPLVSEDAISYDNSATLGPAGASGGVFAATWQGRRVAVKRFVDGVSPDGSPADEMAVARAVHHPRCVDVLAVVEPPHQAMVMTHIQGQPLGGRPGGKSLLRCTYPADQRWPVAFAITCARDVAAACGACAAARVAHGDVYAHNVVVTADGSATLVDFGAAFRCPQTCAIDFQRLEVRAFGLLLQELADRCGRHEGLSALAAQCLLPTVAARPSFADLESELGRML